jgi:hypothetical protein
MPCKKKKMIKNERMLSASKNRGYKADEQILI